MFIASLQGSQDTHGKTLLLLNEEHVMSAMDMELALPPRSVPREASSRKPKVALRTNQTKADTPTVQVIAWWQQTVEGFPRQGERAKNWLLVLQVAALTFLWLLLYVKKSLQFSVCPPALTGS